MEGFVLRHRDRLAVAGALAGPPAVAAVLVPWRSSLPSTNVALLLVVVVVAAAANGRRGPGLLAAVGAALWFDFFWTLPYERFTITARADLETTVLLLIVGAVVSELAARGRRSRQGVRTGSAYLASIHTAAGRAATGKTADELIEQVRGELTEVLALRAARFEQGSYLGHPPRLDEHGDLIWNAGRWDLAAHGLPDQEIELRTRNNGHTLGRFMLTPTPGSAPSAEARRVAVVLADQVGAALAGQAAYTR